MNIDRVAGLVLASSVLLCLTLACGDDNGNGTGPDPTGSVEVNLTVAGEAPDGDGCIVTVDGAGQRRILSGESTTYTGLSVGQHEVSISDVAGNCQVLGDAVRNVSVAADQTATVTYAVDCAQNVGSIEISVSTAGEDQDGDGYEVVIDGGAPGAIGINGSITVGGLTPGDHSVALEDVAANCSIAGGKSRTVAVTARQTATAAFAVTCLSTSGSLRVSASTGGEDLDEDGYEVVIDGGGPSAIGINGSMTAGGLAPGDHSVELKGEAFNCFIAGNNPRTVTVTAGQEADVNFDVTCRYHLYNRIIFGSDRAGDEGLYAVDPRPGSPVRALGLQVYHAAVSSDGLQLAVGWGGDVRLANSDGSDVRVLSTWGDWSGEPAWSPDGLAIAFVREVAGQAGIWTMNADGSNPQLLAADGHQPTWSPDGSRIAFMRSVGGNAEIFVMNANGSGSYNLTNHPARDDHPSWSPLGNLISFQSDRDGGRHIFVVDPAGGPVTNMTIALVNWAEHPTWAPMAAAGAFVSNDSGNTDIYYYDPSVPELVQVTAHSAADYNPFWGGGN